MAENQHTPGPWFAADDMEVRGKPVYRLNDTGHPVTLAHVVDHGHERTIANARLIARAPELLEENERLRYALDALVSIREELQLAEGKPVGRVLYINRLFREARELLGK